MEHSLIGSGSCPFYHLSLLFPTSTARYINAYWKLIWNQNRRNGIFAVKFFQTLLLYVCIWAKLVLNSIVSCNILYKKFLCYTIYIYKSRKYWSFTKFRGGEGYLKVISCPSQNEKDCIISIRALQKFSFKIRSFCFTRLIGI